MMVKEYNENKENKSKLKYKVVFKNDDGSTTTKLFYEVEGTILPKKI